MTPQNKALSVRKRNGRPTYKKVVYVDGYKIRQMLPDLDVIFWHNQPGMIGLEFIPPGEIWIDHRYIAETDFLLQVYRIETMRRFAKTSNYKPIREYLKKKLCEPGSIPPFIERERYDKDNDLTICYVRGDIIRRFYDPAFIFGGHDLYYDFIPKRTVWIDIRQDPHEIKYTLLHEIRERKWMEAGRVYNDAHERAIKIERMARARTNLLWPIRHDQHLVSKKWPILAVEPIAEEKSTSCGPASLKMILNFFGRTYRGKPFSEKILAKLCECNENGTEHAKLIKAAKNCGAKIFAKENGTLAELRYFVMKERLPVLVGWWNGSERTNEEVRNDHNLDEGHFSVVVHITRTEVWLADPWIIDSSDENKGTAGIRKISIKQFMRHSKESRPELSWCDTDTEGYLPVDRWYMVLNFKGKTFRIPGGTNY